MVAKRVILVTPDAGEWEALGEQLAALGYEVLLCPDPAACVGAVRQVPAGEVVVLDLECTPPPVEGLLDALAGGELPAVPVVVLTSRPVEPLRFPLGRYPIRTFVRRPADAERVACAIRAAVG